MLCSQFEEKFDEVPASMETPRRAPVPAQRQNNKKTNTGLAASTKNTSKAAEANNSNPTSNAVTPVVVTETGSKGKGKQIQQFNSQDGGEAGPSQDVDDISQDYGGSGSGIMKILPSDVDVCFLPLNFYTFSFSFA
jgi:hypothetical protein